MASRTSVYHLSHAFWGEDFNSTEGYKCVNKRMKAGLDTCNTLLSVIRQRAKCEEEFSKSLQKNFKPSDCTFNFETGKLLSALETFRLSGERIATEHQTAAKELSECAERVQKLSESLKSEWRVEKEKAKRSIQEKQRLYDRTMNAKRSYHEKAKLAEQAEVTARFAIGQQGQPAEKVEKRVAMKDRAKQESNRAETLYREAVNQLDEARNQWEKDLERYFTFCEEKDKERIRIIHNEVWVLSNILSSTYVATDRCCEDMRLVLEKISPEADIKEFVEKNQTGTKKPAPVLFEPYRNQVLSDTTRNGGVGMRH